MTVSAQTGVQIIARRMYRDFAQKLELAREFFADTTLIEEALVCLCFATQAADEETALFWIERALDSCFTQQI